MNGTHCVRVCACVYHSILLLIFAEHRNTNRTAPNSWPVPETSGQRRSMRCLSVSHAAQVVQHASAWQQPHWAERQKDVRRLWETPVAAVLSEDRW